MRSRPSRTSEARSSATYTRPPIKEPQSAPLTSATGVQLEAVTVSSATPSRLDLRKIKLIVGDLRKESSLNESKSDPKSFETTWRIDPPIIISPGSRVVIQAYRRKTLRSPLQKLITPIQATAEALIDACSEEEGALTFHRLSNDFFNATLAISREGKSGRAVNTPVDHIEEGSDQLSEHNYSKALQKASKQLYDLSSNPRLSYIASELALTIDIVIQASEDFKSCTFELFAHLNGLGEDIYAALSTTAAEHYSDRLSSCPHTVSGIFRLIREACALIHDMAGPAKVTDWLRQKLEAFHEEFILLRRNFEDRKDTTFSRSIYAGQRFETDMSDNGSQSSMEGSDRSSMSHEFLKLEKLLKPQHLESSYHADPCISGTRVDILEDIYSWIDDFEGPNVFWIRGGPGTGKTSIACSILERLDQFQRCASFFLFRQDLYRPDDYFPSLAFSLAGHHPCFKTEISRILIDDSFNPRASIRSSFETLVLAPLRANASALKNAGLAPVVVIGSLDAGYSREQAAQWEALIAALSRWPELPKTCKLIITSCNRGDLQKAFASDAFRHIDLLTTENEHDIRKLLERRVSEIKDSHRGGGDEDALEGWPPPEHIDKVVAHASGYFLWASAAMDFVANSVNPVNALDSLVAAGRTQKLEDLDRVFDLILTDVFKHSKAPPGFRATIGALAVAKGPVSIRDLETLFGERFSMRAPREICASMAAVITPHEEDRMSIFHPCFAEYITDADRSGVQHESFIVDPIRAHLKFTVASLQLMLCEKNGLRFNICDVAPSYTDNDSLTSDHIARCIPFPLAYACRYWAEHLRHLPEQSPSELRRLLELFLQTKLLFWIEAMSYLNAVDAVVKGLAIVAEWVRASNGNHADLALEASRFVATYQDAISLSAPHLYISAIPFLPENSLVRAVYKSIIQSPPCISDIGEIQDPPLSFTFHAGFEIGSVAICADGKRALVGGLQADDGLGTDIKHIFMFDLATGEIIATSAPLGHDQDVKHISLSADESHAVTTSFDYTVMLWDLKNGIRRVGIFQGHNDYVRSADIDFSRGRLVSGSDDTTIMVWDIETKKALYKPLKGHKDWIRQTRFVNCGSRIVSASDDKTIRIWDAENGLELKKIMGNTDSILCLAISPDESAIASGSEDGAIMLFDLQSGQRLNSNLRGRGDVPITSMSYSPQSAQLLCGTGSGIIRVLDSSTLEDTIEPLLGHKGPIKGLRSILDGRHIISASEDGCFIAWDRTLTLEHSPQPTMDAVLCTYYQPEEDLIIAVDRRRIWRWHSSGVLHSWDSLDADRKPFSAAVFACDGLHIATAVEDDIFIWATGTGVMTSGPLSARANEVSAIALSRNGQYLASGTDTGNVLVWDVTTGEYFQEAEKKPGVEFAIAWSPSEERFALDDGFGIRICGLRKTDELALEDTLEGLGEKMWVSFSSDGGQLARCIRTGVITLWDVQNGRKTFSRHLNDLDLSAERLWSAVFSADLEHLTYQLYSKTIGGGSPRTLDLRTGWEVSRFLGQGPDRLQLSFIDKKRLLLASEDGTIRTSNPFMNSPRLLAHRVHTDSVRALAFSPDRRYLASGDDTGRLVLWDTRLNRLASSNNALSSEWIRALVFLPDGNTILSAADDLRVCTWHIPDLTIAGVGAGANWEPHVAPVRAMAVSTDGQILLTGSQDGSAALWQLPAISSLNMNEPELSHRLKGHTAAIFCVALAPNGVLAATGSADFTIRIWSVDHGTLLSTLRGHGGIVRGVSFSLEEMRIISAAEDGTVRTWDAPSGAPLRVLSRDKADPIFALTLLRDGRAITAGYDGAIRIWDTESQQVQILHTHTDAMLAVAASLDDVHIASASSRGRVVVQELDDAPFDQLESQDALSSARRGEDGWLYNVRSERLLWLPRTRRQGFTAGVADSDFIIGTPPIWLDVSRFVHGRRWMKGGDGV